MRMLSVFHESHVAGQNAEGQSGQSTPARQGSAGQGGQGRPLPRHALRAKIPQPQCPPHKDAKGFTLGRGRPLPPVPGLPTVPPAGPGSSSSAVAAPGSSSSSSAVPTSSSDAAAAPESSSLSAFFPRKPTDGAILLRSGAPAAPAASDASSISHHSPGQQLLQRLQGGAPAAPIGQAFLQQLQAGPPSRAVPEADLGKGFLQQLQQGAAAPLLSQASQASGAVPLTLQPQPQQARASPVKAQPTPPGAADSHAGRAFLAQLQSGIQAIPSPAQHAAVPTLDPAPQYAQPAQLPTAQLPYAQQSQVLLPGQIAHTQPSQHAQPPPESNAGPALLQQLRTPQPARQHRSNGQSRSIMSPPGLPQPALDMAAASALSFQQMLHSALNKQEPTHAQVATANQAVSLQHHQQATAGDGSGPAAPVLPQSQSGQEPADAGRHFLQQLQQTANHAAAPQAPPLDPHQLSSALPRGGHKAPAGPEQAVAAAAQAGQLFLQQLQRGAAQTAAGAGASGGAATAVIGAVPGAVQPKPSAPPMQPGVLQQAALPQGIALSQGRGRGRAPGRGRGRAAGPQASGSGPGRGPALHGRPHQGGPGSTGTAQQQPSQQPVRLLQRGAVVRNPSVIQSTQQAATGPASAASSIYAAGKCVLLYLVA